MQYCCMGEMPLLDRSLPKWLFINSQKSALNWLSEILCKLNTRLGFGCGQAPVCNIYSHTDKVWNPALRTAQHALEILMPHFEIVDIIDILQNLKDSGTSKFISVWFPGRQAENISVWREGLKAKWFFHSCFAEPLGIPSRTKPDNVTGNAIGSSKDEGSDITFSLTLKCKPRTRDCLCEWMSSGEEMAEKRIST